MDGMNHRGGSAVLTITTNLGKRIVFAREVTYVNVEGSLW